jgi:hypothetical protein
MTRFGLILAAVLLPAAAAAQDVETVGSRALGMGGAFVAVANDSSATWWNPAALADGPFFSMTLGRAVSGQDDVLPAARTSVTEFSLTTPPAGISYYRWRLSDAPTAVDPADREDEQVGIPLRSLSVSQFGVTVVQTLIPGVHAGSTLKYVRGRLRTGVDDSGLPPPDLLDRADDFAGGDVQHRFDLDLGLLAVGGPLRVGALVRNVREIEFEAPDATVMRLPRQVRLGVAFDATSLGVPVTAALDVDARRYLSRAGERRVVALGGEGWLFGRRLGVRGGARFNTVGDERRTGTAGLSLALRRALYLDGHLLFGGDADEQGWGAAARVSF